MARLQLRPARPLALSQQEALEIGRLAVVAGAATLAVSSSGDVIVLAALLGLLAGDLAVWGTATLAALSVFIRWGTTSLASVAGAQGVLGSAALVGSGAAAAAGWSAAAAVILTSPPGWPVVAFGAAAATVAAGPTLAAGPEAVAVKVAALAVGMGLAWAASRWVPRTLAHGLAIACGVASVALALLR